MPTTAEWLCCFFSSHVTSTWRFQVLLSQQPRDYREALGGYRWTPRVFGLQFDFGPSTVTTVSMFRKSHPPPSNIVGHDEDDPISILGPPYHVRMTVWARNAQRLNIHAYKCPKNISFGLDSAQIMSSGARWTMVLQRRKYNPVASRPRTHTNESVISARHIDAVSLRLLYTGAMYSM